jgi:hypothetical protein
MWIEEDGPLQQLTGRVGLQDTLQQNWINDYWMESQNYYRLPSDSNDQGALKPKSGL